MSPIPCEVCAAESVNLVSYELPGEIDPEIHSRTAQICEVCLGALKDPMTVNAHHWQGLHQTIWSENPAVKILLWRLLNKLNSLSFAQDLLDQLYLDEAELRSAQSALLSSETTDASTQSAKDSNGTVLLGGDSVTLIKDLEVKGAGFTAKRGTLVKNISLTDDPGLVEGRINGTTIVLKTAFLKKAK